MERDGLSSSTQIRTCAVAVAASGWGWLLFGLMSTLGFVVLLVISLYASLMTSRGFSSPAVTSSSAPRTPRAGRRCR